MPFLYKGDKVVDSRLLPADGALLLVAPCDAARDNSVSKKNRGLTQTDIDNTDWGLMRPVQFPCQVVRVRLVGILATRLSQNEGGGRGKRGSEAKCRLAWKSMNLWPNTNKKGFLAYLARNPFRAVAERLGFEPRVHCCTHAFQACTFGRSVTSPHSPAFRIPCAQGWGCRQCPTRATADIFPEIGCIVQKDRVQK